MKSLSLASKNSDVNALWERTMKNRDDEITAFIEEHGVTKIDAAPAALLGESTPGWRRETERRHEVRYAHRKTTSNHAAYQTALADRLGVVRPKRMVRSKLHNEIKPHRDSAWGVCRFFNKLCLVMRCSPPAKQLILSFEEQYGCIGARFYVVHGHAPPTTDSWRQTVHPLLNRLLAKQRR